MKLNIGVIDYQYTEGEKSISTGKVAEYLEDHYAVMTGFAVEHLDDIADDMAESYAGALESILMGGTVENPADQAMSKISAKAKLYLSSREAERVLAPGTGRYPVPTRAALKGISSRSKSGYRGMTMSEKKALQARSKELGIGRMTFIGKRRPSFIDTGMYQNSLIAWTEE